MGRQSPPNRRAVQKRPRFRREVRPEPRRGWPVRLKLLRALRGRRRIPRNRKLDQRRIRNLRLCVTEENERAGSRYKKKKKNIRGCEIINFRNYTLMYEVLENFMDFSYESFDRFEADLSVTDIRSNDLSFPNIKCLYKNEFLRCTI